MFLHTDHLGSTRVCTDASGNSLGACTFEPFGEVQPGSTCSVPTNFRFAGMEWDSETGLYHTLFRQYDPNQGRWMGVDALPGAVSDPQSLNRYAYAFNDAANLTDAFGLSPCAPGCTAITSTVRGEKNGDPADITRVTGCDCGGRTMAPSGCLDVFLDGVRLGSTCDQFEPKQDGDHDPAPSRVQVAICTAALPAIAGALIHGSESVDLGIGGGGGGKLAAAGFSLSGRLFATADRWGNVGVFLTGAFAGGGLGGSAGGGISVGQSGDGVRDRSGLSFGWSVTAGYKFGGQLESSINPNTGNVTTTMTAPFAAGFKFDGGPSYTIPLYRLDCKWVAMSLLVSRLF